MSPVLQSSMREHHTASRLVDVVILSGDFVCEEKKSFV
jgi:hypothetical protein